VWLWDLSAGDHAAGFIDLLGPQTTRPPVITLSFTTDSRSFLNFTSDGRWLVGLHNAPPSRKQVYLWDLNKQPPTRFLLPAQTGDDVYLSMTATGC
jgi:hypothetical protein